MKNTHKACINLMYFMANYPYDFINKCWNDEPWLMNHLIEKFNGYCKNETTLTGFSRFFYNLDTENQVKLLTWIEENYLAFPEFQQD